MGQRILNDFVEFSMFGGIATQEYLVAEDAFLSASSKGCDYYYIEGIKDNMPDAWDIRRLREHIKKTTGTGVTPIFHTSPKIPLCCEIDIVRNSAVDYVSKQIVLASKLGCEALIIHGGIIYDNRKMKESHNSAMDAFLKSAVDLNVIASDENINIWMENLSTYNLFPFKTICSTTEDIALILDEVKDIGFIYDAGHGNINSGMPVSDMCGFFKQYNQRIRAIDFNDNNGDKDSHLPLGRGNISFSNILSILKLTNWNGICVFETYKSSPENNLAYLRSIARGR